MSARRWSYAAFCVLLFGLIPAAYTQAPTYQPASLVRASQIPYPPNTITPGLVTLDVSVDATGAVQKIVAVRDVPPLTDAVRTAVNTWKFTPAVKGGQRVSGVVRVNVVFNPFNPGDVSIPNKPLPPPETGASLAGLFQPPDLKTANYATYPVNTVASGTIVLDVKVGVDGSMQGARVLGGGAGGPLTGMATRGVHDWSFAPATYEGQPTVAHTVVAYVFPSPAQGTP
jgi:outer membrane biosynthesis protein TonB